MVALRFASLRLACMVVVCVLGMTVTQPRNAQAEEGESFLLATATGEQEGAGTLSVPFRNLKISCQEADFEEGTEMKSGTEALVKLVFLTCAALSLTSGKKLPCTVDISPATAIFAPTEHAAKNYLLAKPDEGEILTTVLLLGEECPLPEENQISGTFAAQVTVNKSSIDLVVFSEAIQKLLGDKAWFGKAGTFEAFLNSSAIFMLTGEHQNRNFSVGPEFEVEAGIGSSFLLATILGEPDSAGAFLSVPSFDLKLNCQSTEIQKGSELLKPTKALVKFTFLKCTALSIKTGKEMPCTVENPELSALMRPREHAGKFFVTFEPDESETFGSIVLLGETCVFSGEIPIKGTLAAEVTANGLVVDLILLTEAIQKLLGTSATFASKEIFVGASEGVRLAGAHVGYKLTLSPIFGLNK